MPVGVATRKVREVPSGAWPCTNACADMIHIIFTIRSKFLTVSAATVIAQTPQNIVRGECTPLARESIPIG